jgi:hypothetical protein
MIRMVTLPRTLAIRFLPTTTHGKESLVSMAPTPFLAHNLNVRRAEVEAAGLVTSVGWIGDQAHQAECSDHNPDSTGDVHAIDCMTLDVNNQKTIVQWALSATDDLEYIINQRTIWSRSRNFAPAKYTGTDPHTNHVHISGRHGASGNVPTVTCTGYSRPAEAITPEGITVALSQADIDAVANAVFVKLTTDQGYKDLVWRVSDMVNMKDVFSPACSQKGQPVPTTVAIKAIPTTAAPAAPADAALTAAAVLKNMNLVQKED